MSTDDDGAGAGACGRKNAFDESVKRLELKINSFCIADRDRYDRIVREVMDAKCRVNRKPLDYRRLKRYEILNVPGGRTRLILPPDKCADGGVKYYVHNGELFDVLRASHLDSGHGGLHKMHLNLKRKYVNITRPVIQIFLANCCETCAAKRARHGRRHDGGAADDRQLGAGGGSGGGARVQFVDMRSCRDGGGYRYVMRYTDCGSQFAVLRALETRSADEVAGSLIDIFCTFGAPGFVETHGGDDCGAAAFAGGLSEKLRLRGGDTAWARPDVRCGGPETAAENATAVQLRDFLQTCAGTWSEALRFCQYRANNTYRPDIGQTPFEALFGCRNTRRPRRLHCADNTPDDDGTVDREKFSFFRPNFNLIRNASSDPVEWRPDGFLSDAHNVPDATGAVGLDMRKSSCRNNTPVRRTVGTNN